MKTTDEIESIELRNACIHEAGHLVALNAFGGLGQAEVFKNSAGNVASGERAWVGNMRPIVGPGNAFDPNDPKPLNWSMSRAWVSIGLAGVVAELIDNEVVDAEEIVMSIEDAINDDVFSKSDAALIGDWNEADVSRTLEVLLERWSIVESEAEHLRFRATTEKPGDQREARHLKPAEAGSRRLPVGPARLIANQSNDRNQWQFVTPEVVALIFAPAP